MKICSSILLITLAAGSLTPAFGGEVTPTPASTPAPSPSPSPIPISMELYFRRAAKVIPEPEEKDFEIVEEVPFLTQRDFSDIKVKNRNRSYYLAITLTPFGRQKLTEAGMGNFGRTVVVVLDGTIVKKFKMETQDRPYLHLGGSFTGEEAARLARQVNTRPSPSPTPAPHPTPRQKISVY